MLPPHQITLSVLTILTSLEVILSFSMSTAWSRKSGAFGPLCSSRRLSRYLWRLSRFSLFTVFVAVPKGTVLRDFRPPVVFIVRTKNISILVKNSPSYYNFSKSPRGIIPRRVNLPRDMNPRESTAIS